MKRPIWVALLFIVSVVVAGCSNSGKNGETAEKGATNTGQAAGDPSAVQPAGASILSSNIAKRPSLEGRWVLLFYQRMTGTEVPAALIDIAKSSKDSGLAIKKPVAIRGRPGEPHDEASRSPRQWSIWCSR